MDTTTKCNHCIHNKDSVRTPKECQLCVKGIEDYFTPIHQTHMITIPKEQFDVIKSGDRLIIGNDEDVFSLTVYVD
jgi:hypothetical protein